jgi:hypothetical protein
LALPHLHLLLLPNELRLLLAVNVTALKARPARLTLLLRLWCLLLAVDIAAFETGRVHLLLRWRLRLWLLCLRRPLLALLVSFAAAALLLIAVPDAIAVVLGKRGRSRCAGQENSD